MSPELRGLVKKEALERRPTTRPPYWYPLALPTYDGEEIADALEVMLSYETTMGARTAEFERRFAEAQGAPHGLMVNSGSSADLLLMLAATDPTAPILPRGSTVLVPAVTWPTHVWSVLMAGLQVRLVDVDPATLNITRETLEAAYTPECSAVFVVHLLGNPCPMDEVVAFCRDRKLELLEDCCEALGASWGGRKVGTFGLGGTYSFFFAHHMMTMEGGAIVTTDPRIERSARLMRAHGWARALPEASRPPPPPGVDPRYCFLNWGVNFRPTEVAAAFGLRQLDRLPSMNAARAQRFADVAQIFSEVGYRTPVVREQAEPNWMAVPLMPRDDVGGAVATRERLVEVLEQGGVETRPVVAGNLARQPLPPALALETAPSLVGADHVHRAGLYVGLTIGPDPSTRLREVLTPLRSSSPFGSVPKAGGQHD
jgi:CDP-6-deoxy-D-xylo-4-hexulose-3-dehydrase